MVNGWLVAVYVIKSYIDSMLGLAIGKFGWLDNNKWWRWNFYDDGDTFWFVNVCVFNGYAAELQCGLYNI